MKSKKGKIIIPINGEMDIVIARQTARAMAESVGFLSIDLALITTAVSELVRNIINYAECGKAEFEIIKNRGEIAIRVIVEDKGPGIDDIELAMQDGYSTTNSLGLGLPGVRRLMDELSIASTPGKGTSITATKWLSNYGQSNKKN